MILLERL